MAIDGEVSNEESHVGGEFKPLRSSHLALLLATSVGVFRGPQSPYQATAS